MFHKPGKMNKIQRPDLKQVNLCLSKSFTVGNIGRIKFNDKITVNLKPDATVDIEKG